MGRAAGDWVGAPEDRRTAFHGRRLWGGHPTLFHPRLTPPRQDGPRAGGSRLRSAPRGVKLRGGKLRGPRWLYRRWSEYGGAARSCIGGARRLAGPPHQMGGWVWNWVGAPEDRRTAPAAGFGAATRPCRMEAPTAKRLSGERGREQFGEQLARSRSAGRKAGRPRWLYRRWSEYVPARSCIGGARRLADPPHQMGGRVWNWGVRPGGPEASCSWPQAPGRTPRPCRMEAPTAKRLSGERAGAVRRAACAEPICGAESWEATMALPPMERVRPRTELHRRGTAARRPSPSNGWAGVELGGRAGGPEDGPGRRLRRGHPALQDGGSDGEEAERREGGSSSASSLRGADLRGGKLGGHDGPTADGASTSPHGAASAGHGGSQTLPIKWMGGCGIGWARRRTGGRLFTAAGFGAATRPFQKTAAVPPGGGACAGGWVLPSPLGCLARGVVEFASAL